MNLLEKSSDWLHDQRNKFMTNAVTYKRGANSVARNATVGQTTFDVVNDSSIVGKMQIRDYIIEAADLILASVVVLPAES